jgi:predicted permease
MPHLPTWRRYFRVMPPAVPSRVDEELRFHFEARIEALIAEGASLEDARAQAVREFGDVALITAGLRVIDARIERGRRRSAWIRGVGQDLRVSSRSALRSPAFTAVVVATFALGIGANTVIFSFLSGVLLRPLPYTDPTALVAVWLQNSAIGRDRSPLSAPEVLDLRSAASTLLGVEALQANVIPSTLTINGTPVAVQIVRVSPGMFDLLGRDALLGRTFDGVEQSVVVSYAFWQRQFGGDRSVVGQALADGSRPLRIVGVMPPDFAFPYASLLAGPVTFTDSARVDVWAPLDLLRAAEGSRTTRNLSVVARTQDGVDPAVVRDDLRRAVAGIAESNPEATMGWSAAVIPLHEQVVASVRPALQLLLAGVGLVLLVACVNVANLLLARSATRTREMAMRTALGAGRLRLLRQSLVESVMLAVAGGAAGVLLARWVTSALVAMAPGEIPRLQAVEIDWRVLAFTAAVTVATGILVGVAPALAARGLDIRRLLADGSRGTTGTARRHALRGTLVSAEVALAVILTIGAALLTRSFVAVLTVDPGFESARVLSMQITVPARHTTPDGRREFYRALFERLESVPGVTSVGGTTRLPLGGANSTTQIAVDGREPAEGQWPEVDLRRALGQYFETMRIPILRGRSFDERDGPMAPPVAIINETLARQLFQGEDSIGQRIRLGANAGLPLATVVGVAGDIRHRSLETSPAPEVYISYLQNPPMAPLLVLRTAGDPASVSEAVQAAAREIDSTVNIASVRTMSDLRLEAVAERRFFTSLIGAFGFLALLLAAIGVYGVVTLAVAERRQEIGIRLALGATPVKVARGVLSDALRLATIGTGVGVLLALPLMRLMASQLFGVGTTDPVTLGSVPAVMLVVTAVAALVPAVRAMRADPVTTIRAD